MDSSLSAENQPAPAAPKRRRTFRRLFAAFALLLCVLLLVSVFLKSSQPRVTFLTLGQFNQTLKPGPFTRWKNKLATSTAPVLRPFRGYHPDVFILSCVASRAADAALPKQLGAPVATNAWGMQAWFLPRDKAYVVLNELRILPYSSWGWTAPIHAVSGLPASCTSGMEVSWEPGHFVTIGNTIDFTARTSGTSVSLILDASSTDPVNMATIPPVIRTNFYLACHVLIPDTGNLLINCGHADPASQTNYWLFLTPQLLDASGKPLHPPHFEVPAKPVRQSQ